MPLARGAGPGLFEPEPRARGCCGWQGCAAGQSRARQARAPPQEQPPPVGAYGNSGCEHWGRGVRGRREEGAWRGRQRGFKGHGGCSASGKVAAVAAPCCIRAAGLVAEVRTGRRRCRCGRRPRGGLCGAAATPGLEGGSAAAYVEAPRSSRICSGTFLSRLLAAGGSIGGGGGRAVVVWWTGRKLCGVQRAQLHAGRCQRRPWRQRRGGRGRASRAARWDATRRRDGVITQLLNDAAADARRIRRLRYWTPQRPVPAVCYSTSPPEHW